MQKSSFWKNMNETENGLKWQRFINSVETILNEGERFLIRSLTYFKGNWNRDFREILPPRCQGTKPWALGWNITLQSWVELSAVRCNHTLIFFRWIYPSSGESHTLKMSHLLYESLPSSNELIHWHLSDKCQSCMRLICAGRAGWMWDNSWVEINAEEVQRRLKWKAYSKLEEVIPVTTA